MAEHYIQWCQFHEEKKKRLVYDDHYIWMCASCHHQAFPEHELIKDGDHY